MIHHNDINCKFYGRTSFFNYCARKSAHILIIARFGQKNIENERDTTLPNLGRELLKVQQVQHCPSWAEKKIYI